MPLVRIDMYKGRSEEKKRVILDAVHQSLVEAFKIPEDDRNQRIYEFDDCNFDRRSNKTREFTIIEITAFKGRSRDAKKLLYSRIVEKLNNRAGISPSDIVIYINEPSLENWGIAGGKPADEVELGFKVEI
jgi:phenylpyruvate tautomerase PptA (4-oxalocrotonate tautomerase family)